MPYSITINKKNTIVIGKFWGSMGAEEYFNYLDDLDDRGPFDAPFRLLLLLQADLEFTMSTETVRSSAKRRPQFSVDAKRVIVAPDALAFGLSRLYSMEATTASAHYSVVDNVQEACALLGLESKGLNLEFEFPTSY